MRFSYSIMRLVLENEAENFDLAIVTWSAIRAKGLLTQPLSHWPRHHAALAALLVHSATARHHAALNALLVHSAAGPSLPGQSPVGGKQNKYRENQFKYKNTNNCQDEMPH